MVIIIVIGLSVALFIIVHNLCGLFLWLFW